MEGKTMAIDSSIWIYQFQATVRDKDGRGLVNAHILGFLRRICKLLYYGVKPVFVFDGGAPALKRSTLNERRKKKSGAADSHARVAERLLAAQLRREALKHAAQTQGNTKAPPQEDTEVSINDDAVYLEDLEPHAPLRSPVKKASGNVADNQGADGPTPVPASKADSAEKARLKWQDHDPYKLPEIDFDATIAKAASSAIPDPRLATEEELRAFINDMRPEDYDVNSEAFRELPTEVQYEIIGDLRLKSRQTSHKRLQAMLKTAETPLDFSKAQIQSLKQRNNLTQTLLVTTGMVGKANLTIPVRVASERNREYVLIRNEGANGGWVLGIRDEGTQSKPIEIDAKDDGEDDLPPSRRTVSPSKVRVSGQDQDLREFRQQMALAAIAKRQSPKGRPQEKQKPKPKPKRPSPSKPLFIDDEEAEDGGDEWEEVVDVDPAMMIALKQSIDDADDAELQIAMNHSLLTAAQELSESQELAVAGPSRTTSATVRRQIPGSDLRMDDSDGELYDFPPEPVAPPMQVTVSNASSGGDAPPPLNRVAAASLLFGLPTMLDQDEEDEEDPMAGGPSGASKSTSIGLSAYSSSKNSDEEGSMEEVLVAPSSRSASSVGIFKEDAVMQDSDSSEMEEIDIKGPTPAVAPVIAKPAVDQPIMILDRSSDDGMEEVLLTPAKSTKVDKKPAPSHSAPKPETSKLVLPPNLTLSFRPKIAQSGKASNWFAPKASPISEQTIKVIARATAAEPTIGVPVASPSASDPAETSTLKQATNTLSHSEEPSSSPSAILISLPRVPISSTPASPPASLPLAVITSVFDKGDDDDDAPITDWSRSPTPEPTARSNSPSASTAPAQSNSRKTQRTKDFDAADEIDISEEEGDFAAFISQVKGQDLDAARKEVDDEILALNKEKKAAMRDSEDVTQQMIGQIKVMLRLFGIPYVTAPMEAEAQCATLVQLGLVNGIITDDSDVFLFGGIRVFRNMFNQSKTVEVYLLTDLQRELGLSREKLVNLAYLLGSDYVEGLAGVGPVVAMEILKEFECDDHANGRDENEAPGIKSLKDFKEWWAKVQSGKDGEKESGTKFRKRFKKKFKDLYLPEDWPNPVVRDAYYHPAVDESREEFKWVLPDIDGLRNFLREELGWSQGKVDETLLPIIKRVGQRGQANAINKQSNLNAFFDISAGQGTFAPKRGQAYASKRLQKVVSDFRKGKKAAAETEAEAEEEEEEVSQNKKRKAAVKRNSKGKGKAVERGDSTGPVSKKARKPMARKKRKVVAKSTDEEEDEDDEVAAGGAASSEKDDEDRTAALSLRPKPRLRPRLKRAVMLAQQQAEVGPQEAEGRTSDSGSGMDEEEYVPGVMKGKQKS
ncbi:DNA repair protein rad2 [Tulasnella sp. 332]|nr:DNA repair protein rad2 [Tulasnella sp. 332]